VAAGRRSPRLLLFDLACGAAGAASDGCREEQRGALSRRNIKLQVASGIRLGQPPDARSRCEFARNVERQLARRGVRIEREGELPAPGTMPGGAGAGSTFRFSLPDKVDELAC
jgi:hypothetical protein